MAMDAYTNSFYVCRENQFFDLTCVTNARDTDNDGVFYKYIKKIIYVIIILIMLLTLQAIFA